MTQKKINIENLTACWRLQDQLSRVDEVPLLKRLAEMERKAAEIKERGGQDWKLYGKAEIYPELGGEMDAWLTEVTTLLVDSEADALGIGKALGIKPKDAWSEEYAALKKLHQEAMKLANLIMWDRVGRPAQKKELESLVGRAAACGRPDLIAALASDSRPAWKGLALKQYVLLAKMMKEIHGKKRQNERRRERLAQAHT